MAKPAKIAIQKSAKPLTDHNPVMVQRFGADPYALVYDGRVYLYMTGDKPTYNPDNTLKENTYGNIDTICVISSDDLVNWTDHGTVYAVSQWGRFSMTHFLMSHREPSPLTHFTSENKCSIIIT